MLRVMLCRGAAGCWYLDEIEFAHHKAKEVRGHFGRLPKIDLDQPAGEALPLDLVHVREARHVGRDSEANDEGGLDGGLVPAWETPPGVDGLELRRGHCLFLSGKVGVGRAVKPGHLVVETAFELDVERTGAHCDG